MYPITVAVAEPDLKKRAQLEQFLKQSDHNIQVLTDINTHCCKKNEIKLKFRENQSITTETVARIEWLQPCVVFVNTRQLTQDFCDLLAELKLVCPHTYSVVLVKEQSHDSIVINALKSGARGIVDCSDKTLNISKVIHTVYSGQPWVSRKILTKIMEKILLAKH